MTKKLFGTIATAAVASLIATAASNPALAKGKDKKKAGFVCTTVANNSCKGKGGCKAFDNASCKGKNDCKGKGAMMTKDKAECDAKSKDAPKPADGGAAPAPATTP